MARPSQKWLKEYNARRAAGGASAASTKTLKGAPRDTTVRERKQPNKTEREYEQLYLQPRLHAREIVDYKFHSLALVLGVDWRYYPDFVLQPVTGKPQVHEIKGDYSADEKRYRHAIKSFKAAVEQFGQYFEFFLCEKRGGEWEITQYK